jgi:hypothetical protein
MDQTTAIIKIQNAIRNRNAINTFANRYVERLDEEFRKQLAENEKKYSLILESNKMVNAKDYSVKDLQGALKNLKKTSMFNGKVSGLNKSKMISILNDWNYDFSQLSTKVKTT